MEIYRIVVESVVRLETADRDKAWSMYLRLRSARLERNGTLLGIRGPGVAEYLRSVTGKAY